MKCSNISISKHNTFKEKCCVCAEYFMGDSNAHFVRHAKTLHKCQLFQCAFCSEGHPSMTSFQVYKFWPSSFFPLWNHSYAFKITLKKHDFIPSFTLWSYVIYDDPLKRLWFIWKFDWTLSLWQNIKFFQEILWE